MTPRSHLFGIQATCSFPGAAQCDGRLHVSTVKLKVTECGETGSSYLDFITKMMT